MDLSNVILDYEVTVHSAIQGDIVIKQGHYYSMYEGGRRDRSFFYVNDILTRNIFRGFIIQPFPGRHNYNVFDAVRSRNALNDATESLISDDVYDEYISYIKRKPAERLSDWGRRLRNLLIKNIL